MSLEDEWKEYPRDGYVKSIIVKKQQDHYAELTLTTLEGRVFELVWSAAGIIDTATQSKYETFENLLRTHSPLYTERFSKMLYEKLSALQQPDDN